MIEEEAFVADVNGRQVWVEKNRKPACAGCAEHCASSLVGRYFPQQTIRFSVSSPLELKPGDRVVVGLQEHALMRGACRMYLFPLLALFAGALIGKAVAEMTGLIAPDSGSALGGVSGLILCLAVLKFSRFFDRTGLQPVILRKIN